MTSFLWWLLGYAMGVIAMAAARFCALNGE